MWCVCIYMEDKEYGGPEEGGWWYNAGYPLPKGTGEQSCQLDDHARFFMEHREAVAWAQRLEEQFKDINNSRPSISSMRSSGRYTVKVTLGLPKAYPEERPHYE
jgi:hypothetical protein